MGVSYKHHAPSLLSPGTERPVHIVLEAGWAPELFWMCWKEQNLNALARGETYREKYWSLYIQSTTNILSLSFLLLPLWSIGQLWNALFHFSFLILGHSGVLGWGSVRHKASTYINTE
jgi:hypothetical protein